MINVPKQKYKGINGNWRTRSLFVDVGKVARGGDNEHDPANAFYYLFDKDDEDQTDPRPHLKTLYLDLRDITGLKMAKQHLAGWAHFQALLKCTWFQPIWKEWQAEMAAQMKSEAMEVIKTIMAEGTTQSFAAAKYIANEEYNGKEGNTSKRGRPSKEEVEGELKKQVSKISKTEEDYNRMMGLTVISGGKK